MNLLQAFLSTLERIAINAYRAHEILENIKVGDTIVSSGFSQRLKRALLTYVLIFNALAS